MLKGPGSDDVRIRIVFAEVLIFGVIAITLGYIFKPDDPLLINQPAGYYMALLAVMTLYYGLTAGLIALALMGIAIFLAYKPFPYQFFLWHLLFSIIFGEFHFFWTRRTSRLNEENKYLVEKVEDIGKTLFILKVSHDQLERNYILKPFSMRAALYEIRKKLLSDGDETYYWFVKFLSRTFNIGSASLYIREESGFKEAAKIGKGTEVEADATLIRRVMEDKNAAFVSVSDTAEEELSPYLAVVPAVDGSEEVTALLLINEMPFLSLNADNMLTISLFMTYFFDEKERIKKVSPMYNIFPVCDSEFLNELIKLSNLKHKLNVDSNLIVFDIEDNSVKDHIFQLIQAKVRGADLLCRYEAGSVFKTVILLPLTSTTGAFGFLNRILKEIQENFGKSYLEGIRHRIIPVSNKPAEALSLVK